MRLKPLQTGFCASFAVHAVFFGIAAAVGFRLHPPAIQEEKTPLVVTFIDAPDEPETSKPAPAGKVSASVPTPISAPVTPIAPTKPEPVKVQALIETPKPVRPMTPTPAAPAQLTMREEPPARVPPPALHPAVRGDGGASMPGRDGATSEGNPGVTVQAHPSYLKNPEPEYPLAARRRREQGVVILKATVTATGRVAAVEVERRSGFPLLDESALKTVRGYEFEPARRGGTPVESQIEVPVRFKLTE